jgi:carboxyl-terminal processing protease
MNRKKLFIFLSLVYLAQTNAQVSEKDMVDRLFYTCKVWGYIKYHHTNITKGMIDWDSTLLISLNGIKTAPNQVRFQDSLNKLLYRAGALKEYIDYWAYRGDSIKINKNFSWFNDPYLSQAIKDTLYKINVIFKNESSYYLSVSSRPPLRLFEFDAKYAKENIYPDENKRILAVFRYWNLIQYFYSQTPLLKINWDVQLKTYILEAIKSKNAEEYTLTMRRMTKSIDDSKATYSSPVYDSIIGDAYCPFRVRYVENKTIIVDKLASISELEIGDEITKINDVPMEIIRDFYRPLAEGANIAAVERNVNDLMVKGPKDKFNLTLIKKDKSIAIYDGRRDYSNFDSLYIDKISDKPWKDTTLKDGCRYGIIDMTKYHYGIKQIEMLEDLWKTDGWIFDLRGNIRVPFSEFVPYIYLDSIRYYFTIQPNIQIPGEFYFLRNTSPVYSRPIYDKNIIILVDENTKGMAEEFGLSFQLRKNITIVGSTTDGSGVNSTGYILLPGKIRTQFSLLTATNKNKESYHSIGIKPHHIVTPTVADIHSGRDRVMEFVLKCEFASKSEINNLTKSEIKIYPNPVIDYLTIELAKNELSTSIELYDVLGKKILAKTLKFNESKLDLTAISKGIYILKLENQSTGFRIIKE